MSESTSKSVVTAILQALGVAFAFAVLALVANGIKPGYFAALIGAVPRSEFEQYQKDVAAQFASLNGRVTVLEGSTLKDLEIVMLRNMDTEKSLIDDKSGTPKMAPGGGERNYRWQVLGRQKP